MSAVTDSYAKAWLELALEKDKVEDMLSFFEGVKEGFSQNTFLLKHPKLKPSDVLTLFKSLTEDAFFIALIKNLLDHQRMPDLIEIIDGLFTLHQTLNRSKVLYVTTATPLRDEEVEAIKKPFSHYQDTTVQVTIDPTIIGGLKISYDDKVLDATSQTLLKRLKQTISR